MSDTSDVNEEVRIYEEALKRTPVGHEDRPSNLSTLALSLWDRFNWTSDRADLDRTIDLEREALELTPLSDPERAQRADDLSASLYDRYTLTKVTRDLDLAIKFGREALELTPSSHPDRGDRARLLSTSLRDRYARTKIVRDLEDAIEFGQESVSLSNLFDSDMALRTGNLAKVLLYRYELTGTVKDLDRAIQLSKDALEGAPNSHPRHARQAIQLANFLQIRYTLKGRRKDLEYALIIAEQAVQAWRYSSSARSSCLRDFATILNNLETRPSCLPIVVLGTTLNTASDVRQQRLVLLREAAHHPFSYVDLRLSAAGDWYTIADTEPSALEAARCILELLEGTVGQARSLEGQYDQLTFQSTAKIIKGFAPDAAALAINAGDVLLAVELLEQGRGIIFSQLGRFRVAVDDVEAVAPELAAEFTRLSAELNRILGAADGNDVAGSGQDRGLLYTQVQTKWNELVNTIRQRAGLESFLRHPHFSQLQEAAIEGPVIIVNISKRRSDVIIIFYQDQPVLVPLPEDCSEEVDVLTKRLGPRPAKLHDLDLVPILRDIWDLIGRPIARALRQNDHRKGRIWWCPTGTASQLPLHAAGPYMAKKRNFYHMYTQSYTPTLAALLRARQLKMAGPSNQNPVKSLLLVGLPEVDVVTPDPTEPADASKQGQVKLPKVVDEIQAIERCAPHATTLMSNKATCEAVLAGLNKHSWIHLACHGHHHPDQPFLSHFSMWDGPLSVLDLVRMDLPNAELAVLSACHSAKISKQLPDEVLHPAAGMLFTGFKSVVGTMWALDDVLGSELSGEFYQQMLGGPEGPKDYTEAAKALADSLTALRESKTKMNLAQWVNVIHVGV